jgi:hypothetical protein
MSTKDVAFDSAEPRRGQTDNNRLADTPGRSANKRNREKLLIKRVQPARYIKLAVNNFSVNGNF